jgi:hypothetical protein
MKPFTFAPHEFTDDFKERSFVHIRNGLSAEFLEFAIEQLVSCRESGHNELSAREIKSKKKQYLFDLPDDEAFLSELFAAIATVTGCSQAGMTLSERHIMIYDNNAAPLPALHKDRVASTFSVGIPLEPSGCDRIALLPWSAREENLLDNAVYCERTPNSLPDSAAAWDLAAGEYPHPAKIDKPTLVELEARPGDVVIFRGSSIYHGRLYAARSSVLYFKFNTMRLDPLGEDPSTGLQREKTLEILHRKSDAELLASTVELSPRLQHLYRQYSRVGWNSVLRASVSGAKEFTISEDDLRFLFALRGQGKVRDVLIELGIHNDQLILHAPRLRRLGTLGGIDFLT